METGYLDSLNVEQRRAVEYGTGEGAFPGPLLVIAGAGTGKTNTLAHRVAHLIVNGADPHRVLLLTFSRRAAAEMKRRVETIVGRAAGRQVRLPWAGTFHAVGVRLLREYLTLAICVGTRVVPGFYMSYDPPSAFGVGQCLATSILPKDEWLAVRGMNDITNPVMGFMNSLHTDGGSEHDNNQILSFTKEYGIHTIFRPSNKPSWGGHIERLIKTVADELKDVLGASFSNPAESKENHPSRGKAAMTLEEAERWAANLLWKEYHHVEHESLGISPIESYANGIIMTANRLGSGAPRLCSNPLKLRRDVLPMREVEVNPRYGIRWDYIEYCNGNLDFWRFNPHPEGKKFIARRHPKHANSVLFLNPLVGDYVEINMTREVAPITQMEIDDAKDYVKAMGWQPSMSTVLRARDERAEIEREAKLKTMRARRKKERKYQDGRFRELEGSQTEPVTTSIAASVLGSMPDDTKQGSRQSTPSRRRAFDPMMIDLTRISRT
jgi:hypothetical protein